jgi:hypothetical protein
MQNWLSVRAETGFKSVLQLLIEWHLPVEIKHDIISLLNSLFLQAFIV